MKKSFILLSIFFVFIIKINAQFFPEPDPPNGSLSEVKRKAPGFWICNSQVTDYKIAKQNSSNRRFKYKFAFWNECYSGDPSDECGWSKVGRIHFRQHWSIDKTKLLVGWRSDHNNENIIKLSAFFHEVPDYGNWDQFFVSHYLTIVQTDHWVNVDMFLGLDIIALIIDNKAIGISKPGYIPSEKTSKLARTFWFGGDCCPPRDMAVQFDTQYYDQNGFNDHFNSVDIMTWNITEFDSGDEGDFYAFDEVHGSISDVSHVQYHTNHPNPEKQKCIIKNGANINFSAGNKVVLHPGFKAESGCVFLACINQRKRKEIFIPEKANLPPLDLIKLENFNNSDSNIKNDNSVVILRSEKNGIRIYPNPNTGIFNIENNNDVFRVFSIKVINIMGKTVYHKESISADKTEINIKSQSKGIYFVKVEANGNIFTKKMVYL